MGFSLRKFIRPLDDFGHPLSLTYKGQETHQSCAGGLLTLLVMVLTVMMALIKVQKVFTMSDPTIVSFARPLTEKMRSEINMLEYKFNAGFRL